MHCNYHVDREADNHCACCGVGLCSNCSQAMLLGEYYCFNCAIFISKSSDRKKWLPLKYASIILAVLILVLIGTLLLQ